MFIACIDAVPIGLEYVPDTELHLHILSHPTGASSFVRAEVQ